MIIKRVQYVVLFILLCVCFLPGAAAADEEQRFVGQTFSREELAQMLAPIALYPDALLSQVLMAATYPFEVVEADRWLTSNPYVTGDTLDEALQAKDWDVSVLSLCYYPKVLTMMSDNLSWTARVGDAFTRQEEEVMDTIQELRASAHEAGNLVTTGQQQVILEDRYIRIEPVRPGYIYVPAYDPYVVYGSWWYPMFPPFAIVMPGLVVSGPGIFFSPLFYVGFDVFGWTRCNWRERNIVIINIDRTRRFNRRYHDHKRWEHRPWRPDLERRLIREKRASEIPRFHPAVKPVPDGRRWDRKPGEGPVPDKRIIEPRPLDREKKPEPGVLRREKRIHPPGPKDREKPIGTIGPMEPRVTERNRITPADRRRIDQEQPSGQPRVIDRGTPYRPDPAGVEKGRPVIRDPKDREGIEPWKRDPSGEKKSVAVPGAVRPQDAKTGPQSGPFGGKPAGGPGAMERTDRPASGDMQRENRRP